MQSQRLRNTKLSGVSVYLNAGRKKDALATESNDFGLDVSVVGSLKTETLTMTAETLNFWLCKFVQEVRGGDGNKYPEKTLYQLICCIKRYYEENGRKKVQR